MKSICVINYIVLLLFIMNLFGCSGGTEDEVEKIIRIESTLYHNQPIYFPNKTTLNVDIWAPVESYPSYDTAVTTATIEVGDVVYGYSEYPIPRYVIQFQEGLMPDSILNYRINLADGNFIDNQITTHHPITLKNNIGDTLYVDSDFIYIDDIIEDTVDKVRVQCIRDEISRIFVGDVIPGNRDSINISDFPSSFDMWMVYQSSSDYEELNPIIFDNTIYKRFAISISEKSISILKR